MSTIDLVNTVSFCDIFELSRKLDNGSIDMILCDLPYGSTNCSWDSVIDFNLMWSEFNRVIKNDGAIVLFAKPPFSAYLITSNPTNFRYKWYMEKAKGANIAQTAYRPLAVIEEILVFSLSPAVYSVKQTMKYHPEKYKKEKPDKRKYNKDHTVITEHSDSSPMRNPERLAGIEKTYDYYTPRNLLYSVPDKERIHPTQKSVTICEYLIKCYTDEKGVIFDPCVGSGTTAIASINTNRFYIVGDSGIDKKTNMSWADISKDRIKKHSVNPRLF